MGSSSTLELLGHDSPTMSTAQRRRGKSLHLDLPGIGSDDYPQISALFLIQFDVKAGYTIAWKRNNAGLELDDSVEFKSLPSGLHNVKEDLVYFMHGDNYAGISAFVNKSNDQWERNTLMIAVGALLPLEQGRLGRSWKHASNLKALAKELVSDPSHTKILEEYWQDHQQVEGTTSPSTPKTVRKLSAEHQTPQNAAEGQAKGRSRIKSISSIRDVPTTGLSPHHPAISLPSLIDTFGPLIYPLYKAALLRKRILLVNEAPVELACNFVYDVSIISNIPSSVYELVPLEPLPIRLQPLFSVGVHDIDDLAQRHRTVALKDGTQQASELGYGWIACTTDDVLGMKTDLYDVLIRMPPSHAAKFKEKVWPSMKTSSGEDVRASQRDLRRYRTLRQSQKRASMFHRSTSPYNQRSRDSAIDTTNEEEDDETNALLPPNMNETFDDSSSVVDEKMLEPLSWSALAYNSFMWWASAGEKRTDLDDEHERDSSMFRDFNYYADTPGGSMSRRPSSGNPMTPVLAMMAEGAPPVPEMAIIAYFNRLTTSILTTLAELVDAADSSEESAVDRSEEGAEGEAKDDDEKNVIHVGSEDMTRMGLDVWSDRDQRFVAELLEFYWGREAYVQGGRIDCCGVRIV